MNVVLIVLLWLSLAVPGMASADGLSVSNPSTDSNGVLWYDALAPANGPASTTLRVLPPTNPSRVTRRFIYVLPVTTGAGGDGIFGDAVDALRRLDVHNRYNAHVIAPSFMAEPWYADHASAPEARYETFMVDDLLPWVRSTFGTTQHEEHWVVGFSKSGFGAVTLLFRNPMAFDAAAAWDFPADQPDALDWNMLDNYGTDASFQANYRLTDSWIDARKAPFQAETRLWLSYDEGSYSGTPTFLPEVSEFANRLQARAVKFSRTGGTPRAHAWDSGWLPEAIAALHSVRYTARDDFSRPDGPLGANWVMDPQFGTGIVIGSAQAAGATSGGGAHFWNAQPFAADQFSEVKLTSPASDWVGVIVRGHVSPAQGYWLVVKSTGAYLYSFLNGVFDVLEHDPTPWAAGDILRLEVRTLDANTARLTAYRNGAALLTHDATEFIASGQPGIGLSAGVPVALDDWQGGELPGLADGASEPAATDAHDDFDRADGGLGANWVSDPNWGNGVQIRGQQVSSAAWNGGAHFWTANTFAANQYSEVTLTGAVGVWAGVVVRGNVMPAHGYWLAIKDDGAYLYAYVNGTFYLLVHDVTVWATGDTVRLEVQTTAPSTAQLTVHRNGVPLIAHNDAEHFIDDGRPGIGLFATTGVAVDSWRGGSVSAN